jgi:hypothetical protein
VAVGKRDLEREIAAGIKRLRQTRRSKYGNIAVYEGGLRFDSKREHARWRDLQLLLKAGRIRKLRRQVRYPLEVEGVLICTYVADFVYEEYSRVVHDKAVTGAPVTLVLDSWDERVEDSKGKRTREYLMKKKLMLAVHGINIVES